MGAAMSKPAVEGTLVALLSALAFGLTTPLVQRLGRGSGSFATACLLYGGAAVVGLASRSHREAPLVRSQAPRVVLVAVFGALLAPVLLAWGLGRASGTAASLMLNLEAVFTVVLARLLYREHVGSRVGAAAAIILAAGAALVLDPAHSSGPGESASVTGLVAIAAAAFAWSVDNALSKPLAAFDPGAVVAAKAAIGAALSAALALSIGDRWPRAAAALGLLAVGATGYGLSLRLYLRAQRALGAGRTASVFASAPFWGAGLAWALGEHGGVWTVVAAVAMAAGLALHLTERHGHVHVHEALAHTHLHSHDDGHHDHDHDPMPDGPHAHLHHHGHLVHEHPHVPDLHHAHGHGPSSERGNARKPST